MATDESVTAMEEQAEAEEPADQPEEELATEDEAKPEGQEETQAAEDDEDDIGSSSGEQMPPEDEWEEPDPDSLMRSERKHEWISEPGTRGCSTTSSTRFRA